MDKQVLKEYFQQIKDDAFLQEKRINIEECIESKNIPACLYCEEYEHCILLVDYTRAVASLIRSWFKTYKKELLWKMLQKLI